MMVRRKKLMTMNKRLKNISIGQYATFASSMTWDLKRYNILQFIQKRMGLAKTQPLLGTWSKDLAGVLWVLYICSRLINSLICNQNQKLYCVDFQSNWK